MRSNRGAPAQPLAKIGRQPGEKIRFGYWGSSPEPEPTVNSVGFQSDQAYGVTGIPHAFLIGRDGKLLWHGHPADDEFEKKIAEALKGK